MRKVLVYLIDFQRKHFDLKLYATVAAFLGLSLAINYSLNFENTYVDRWAGSLWHLPPMFLWQGLPFLVVCFILYAYNIKRDWLTSRQFWLRFFIGFSILAFDRSFFYHNELKAFFSGAEFYFIKKCVRWASSIFSVVLPLMVLSFFLERNENERYYGLAMKKFDVRPYFQLLGIAVVIIGIGSFFSDIQEYYPRYLASRGPLVAKHNQLPYWLPTIIYELCYASDFLGVEVMFRGFLLFAFTRTLGGYAVLPMIATYCFLHFGKPWPEAFSSIFGGYILGVIAINTRNVWGGVIIHIGVAWAMELFGYLQRLI